MKAAALRTRFFNNESIHRSRHLVDGLVGNNDRATPPQLPLTAGCWGVIYFNKHIYLGKGVWLRPSRNFTDILLARVMTFYSKEAGAGSKHAWQLSTTSISSLSYVVIQAYETLPSTQFLCKMQDYPTTSSSGTLLLSMSDCQRTFREMVNCKEALDEVTKELDASMRKVGKA